MPYYADRADFEKNLRYLINNQTNLAGIAGRLNYAPAAGLIASQGDINIILARLNALEKTLTPTVDIKALAAELAPLLNQATTDNITAALQTITFTAK